MSVDNDKGSTWAVWDLHIHTPDSIVQSYPGGTDQERWESFISDLEALPESFKAIGINDYMFLDGYRKVLQYKKTGRLKNIELILPVIELRIKAFAGSEGGMSKVNLHVIFDSELSAEQIEAGFLHSLSMKYQLTDTGKHNFNSVLTKDSLSQLGEKIRLSTPADKQGALMGDLELGFANLTIPLDDITKALEQHVFDGKYLLAVGKTEWNSIKWTQSIADKKTIINSASLVFSASSTPAESMQSRDKLLSEGVNARLLDCSDAHFHSAKVGDVRRIGNCHTWIKANRTFSGLRFATIEYEKRVFLGEIPDSLLRQASAPHKYIESISIIPSDQSQESPWFNCRIPINPGLVTIVGNKGSGKSALVDVVALLGSSDCTEYSFLSSSRFRKKPPNLAGKYMGTLQWKSGLEISLPLSDDVPVGAMPLVRYLPQKHLQALCEEIPGQGDTRFEAELKRIIFGNLPDSEREDGESLDKVIELRTSEQMRKVATNRSTLAAINSSISKLESLIIPSIVGALAVKREKKVAEIALHDKMRPKEPVPVADNPDIQNSLTKIRSDVHSLELELEGVVKLIDESNAELLKTRIGGRNLGAGIERIKEFAASASELRTSLKDDLAGIVNPEEIDAAFSVQLNLDSLKLTLEGLRNRFRELTLLVRPDNELGLAFKQAKIVEDLTKLRTSLGEGDRRFNAEQHAMNAWTKARQALEGKESEIDSLVWIDAQIALIADAPGTLDGLYKRRKEALLTVLGTYRTVLEEMKHLYEPAINRLKVAFKSDAAIDFNTHLRFDPGAFAIGFMETIDRSKRGTYYGVEQSEEHVRNALSVVDFDSDQSIFDFCEALTIPLRQNTEGQPIEPAQGLRAGTAADKAYNFIYGLEWLRPAYRLLFEENDVAVLSPGQRGLVLLLFYLLVDVEDIPLVVDQPEENLDNETVGTRLSKAFGIARGRRQVILVTHNPNLAVVCDADQVIWARKSGEQIEYQSGALENPETTSMVIKVLEGTRPSFDMRSAKYEFFKHLS